MLAYNETEDVWKAVFVTDNGELNVGVVPWPTTAVVYNVTMTAANTEYSQALPADCKKFAVKCRGEYDLKLAFAEGQSGTTFITIPASQCYWDDLIQPASLTLYVQCATAAQVAEIVAWS
jgi:hypothetical protein